MFHNLQHHQIRKGVTTILIECGAATLVILIEVLPLRRWALKVLWFSCLLNLYDCLQCESCIWGYMGFAAFQILFLVLGTIVIQLVQLQPLPIDLFSFLFVLWNFAASFRPSFSPQFYKMCLADSDLTLAIRTKNDPDGSLSHLYHKGLMLSVRAIASV